MESQSQRLNITGWNRKDDVHERVALQTKGRNAPYPTTAPGIRAHRYSEVDELRIGLDDLDG